MGSKPIRVTSHAERADTGARRSCILERGAANILHCWAEHVSRLHTGDTVLRHAAGILVASLLASAASAQSDAPVALVTASAAAPMLAQVDTPAKRPRAVEYSDAYYTRLTIHRWGSYTMLPLFVAEYVLGDKLINDEHPSSWLKPAHVGVAAGIGVLFTTNTITGAWNLWEARNDAAPKTRRYLHAALMTAADAGFVWSGASAPGRENGGNINFTSDARHHRDIALGSMAIATASTLMMWFWKD